MAQARTIDQLDSGNTAVSTDQFVINRSTGNNTFEALRLDVGELFSTLPANVQVSVDTLRVRQESTPTIPPSSNTSCSQGQVWYDGSYLYIAVQDNLVKRVALSVF